MQRAAVKARALPETPGQFRMELHNEGFARSVVLFGSEGTVPV